jgi:hypothetical protein
MKQKDGVFDPNVILTFVNVDDRDFTGTWAGNSRTFKPGESVDVPEYLAWHYAKHLVNQVTGRSPKDMQNEYLKDQILERCMLTPRLATDVSEVQLLAAQEQSRSRATADRKRMESNLKDKSRVKKLGSYDMVVATETPADEEEAAVI